MALIFAYSDSVLNIIFAEILDNLKFKDFVRILDLDFDFDFVFSDFFCRPSFVFLSFLVTFIYVASANLHATQSAFTCPNTRTRCGICSKLTIKTPKRRVPHSE